MGNFMDRDDGSKKGQGQGQQLQQQQQQPADAQRSQGRKKTPVVAAGVGALVGAGVGGPSRSPRGDAAQAHIFDKGTKKEGAKKEDGASEGTGAGAGAGAGAGGPASPKGSDAGKAEPASKEGDELVAVKGSGSGSDEKGGFTEKMLHELENDDIVHMVFTWDGGGKSVYITGTFTKWAEKIPMRRSGNEFICIRALKRGTYAYKFIVDDQWCFAPDQPTVADPNGYINNIVDLSDFSETFGADMKPLDNQDHITDDDLYNNFVPDPEDPQWYAKDPPPLPPHLRHIILNTPQADDCLAAKAMQVPQNVTLNHLYCSAIKENLMVLGVTQRYREKFVTTVFYSPLPDAKLVGSAAAAASMSTAKSKAAARSIAAAKSKANPPAPPRG